ncbi:MAG: RimK family alpha-L-glutamate ligase [Deltaproteobacteria bacterium]|nr:RimK family alpha-L-glutamate ligase [Deltaproteobacteria bacterium]
MVIQAATHSLFEIMTMLIGIVTVRNHRYHPNRRLLESAGLLGHEASLIHPGKLYLGAGERGLRMDWLAATRRPQVLLPRIGATIKEYGLTVIRQFDLMGVHVVNRYEALILASNKFLSLQALCRQGIPVPETRYASNRANFEKAVSSLGGFPVVIKIARSRQGSGVFLLDSQGKGKAVLEEELNTGRGLLVQSFISPERRRDYRLMVVGERVVGAMVLMPQKGEFRANIHLGGRAEAFEPAEDLCRMAVGSAKALGLDIAGVDVIEEEGGVQRVLEVNSSPGFKGLESCSGKDVASEIIGYAVKDRESGYENSLCDGQTGVYRTPE